MEMFYWLNTAKVNSMLRTFDTERLQVLRCKFESKKNGHRTKIVRRPYNLNYSTT